MIGVSYTGKTESQAILLCGGRGYAVSGKFSNLFREFYGEQGGESPMLPL